MTTINYAIEAKRVLSTAAELTVVDELESSELEMAIDTDESVISLKELKKASIEEDFYEEDFYSEADDLHDIINFSDCYMSDNDDSYSSWAN